MARLMDKTASQLFDASHSLISENDHHWIMAANSLALYEIQEREASKSWLEVLFIDRAIALLKAY